MRPKKGKAERYKKKHAHKKKQKKRWIDIRQCKQEVMYESRRNVSNTGNRRKFVDVTTLSAVFGSGPKDRKSK